MYEIAKTVSFWIVFTIGACCGIVGVYHAIDWFLTTTLKSFGVYSEIVDYMISRHRKKRPTE